MQKNNINSTKRIRRYKINKKVMLRNICALCIVGVSMNLGASVYQGFRANADFKLSNKSENAYVNLDVGNKKYTYKDISIMGYKPIDYAQSLSYILTTLKDSGKDPSDIKLNGSTLEEHLYNLNLASKIEDVNPIVVLSQQLIETGFFGFEGSSVKPEYFNYAGLGATNENPEPEKFPNNYTGQLAQIQHLVAYASTKDVNSELVDKRFHYVTNRGADSTLTVLNQRWAVGNPNYATQIAEKYSAILSHKINTDILKQYQGKQY